MAGSSEAHADPKSFYDLRYQAGYMHGFDYDIYEAARVVTIRQVIGDLKAAGFSPKSILDYGCGEGRYVAELPKYFADAAITGCDISDVGLGIAARENPHASFVAMRDERIDRPDESFDFILSVEVLEHVRDVRLAIAEICRVLKPGGRALITTPCANRWSAEWMEMRLTGGLEPSPDGFGRFRSDEPGHLRRLNDNHLRDMFGDSGVGVDKIFHRTHFFTFLATTRLGERLPMKVRLQMALLDWRLFKHLPNGATLLALCRKP